MSITHSLQHQVFLASCSWAINFPNMCCNGELHAAKLQQKLASECDKSNGGAVTNLRQ